MQYTTSACIKTLTLLLVLACGRRASLLATWKRLSLTQIELKKYNAFLFSQHSAKILRGRTMEENSSLSSGDLDFDYEDSPIKVVVLSTLQEISVGGILVGPIDEGKELETKYWIAEELAKAGYARFRDEDVLTYSTLNKLHWRETKLSPGLQISPLPEYFYPKLRRYLSTAREKASKEPTAASQYLQADRLAEDIINCRLRKIVSLAASSTKLTSIVQALSKEERAVFEKVRYTVTDWEKKILDLEKK